jgi:hypothetical protein
MSQKEDILEQIVEEYLTHQGYFVQHNIKYRPDKNDPDYDSKKDSVHSDIDVLAYNPLEVGPKKVLAVNIKSWQGGFDFRAVLEQVTANKQLAEGNLVFGIESSVSLSGRKHFQKLFGCAPRKPDLLTSWQ